MLHMAPTCTLSSSAAHISNLLSHDHLWPRHQTSSVSNVCSFNLQYSIRGTNNVPLWVHTDGSSTGLTLALIISSDAASDNKMFVTLQGCTIVLSLRCYVVSMLSANTHIAIYANPNEKYADLKFFSQDK